MILIQATVCADGISLDLYECGAELGELRWPIQAREWLGSRLMSSELVERLGMADSVIATMRGLVEDLAEQLQEDVCGGHRASA